MSNVAMLCAALAVSTAASADDVCADRLGTAEQRAQNERRRTERRLLIVDGEHAVDIVHRHTPLSAPTVAQIPSLTVERILPASPPVRPAPSALISIDDKNETCASRLYEVAVDDEISAGISVVAILHSGILVERGEDLFFISAAGSAAPAFRMVWHSAIRFPSTPPPPSTSRNPPSTTRSPRGRR